MRRPEPRPELQSLQPYRSSPVRGGRIFLHANENPYPLPPDVMDEIIAAAAKLKLNRYPDPDPTELVSELASYVGVDPSWIWVGDGSNEVLLQACLAYGGPGRTALLFEPTYVMHHRQARMAGTDVKAVRRREDFWIDVDEALAAIDELKPDVVFVCSPNNPTGTLTPLEDLRKISEASPGLVLVDEAYFEFSNTTLVRQLAGHPNVVVVRTLSKAFRLAAVRLGYGVASPEILENLGRVRMPYGQSSFTILAATIAMRHRSKLLDVVTQIVGERDRVADSLAAMDGIHVFPGAANFVLFHHPRAADILSGLARKGIVIRDFGHVEGCENCLRVTIGTPQENNEFLEATAALL